MKFRGKMVEISSIQHFTRILNTVGKLTKIAVLRIVPSHMYLTFNERITSGGSSLWCEIPQDHYFCEFNMEEVELPSLHSNSRFVVHDVPVLVIPRRLWGQFQEPSMIQFDVSIYMPSLKIVRSVVERMKNIGTFMVNKF
ncbi:checkpoint protein HUS1 [Trichonephila clavata]|uniref:Checkpoint protein HUS1 n=1 Tax=Trichonephila clavata TaxID=2740835 RepID=A0A8X6L109_TRICU|nr:checkpoint protein HUS1 [Trichonephila clavata]